jgi:hypothetical protein
MTCRKCGQRLPAASGPGRPALYCSTGCRRAAEYELRRVQAALERAEESLRWHRESIALGNGGGFMCCGLAKARHVELLEAERAGLEERLRGLLDDEEGGAS